MNMITVDVWLPVWMPVQSVIFYFAALAGLFMHFITKRFKGEISGSLYGYLVIDHPGATFASMLSLIAATFAAVAVGGIEEMKITTLVASGFTTGWALDSAINRGV